MKSEIFHLIILDESGSMQCINKQTISGCNETIDTIRSASRKFAKTQDHYVSIFAFQSGGGLTSRYLIKNAPVDEVRYITSKDYTPNGCTPLYDAIGTTLTDLKVITKHKELAVGSVTIITDGMENSSSQYSRHKVANMIEALKEMGWNFNFIGANIDVDATAHSLNIDNTLTFEQDAEGTQIMFARERRSRMDWLSRSNQVMEEMADMSAEDSVAGDSSVFQSRMKEASKNYFRQDNDDDDDHANK